MPKVLKIYSKLTKQLEIIHNFEKMTMYVCGPTLYSNMHIGNGRSLIVFDVFFRFFKHIFQKVVYVRNITDVEDKIINKALEQKTTPQHIVDYYEIIFKRDGVNLNLLAPTFEPKVTHFISQIIEYIEKIIANGHGYATSCGNVYFAINTLKNYDFFQKREQLIQECGNNSMEDKKDLQDFALWKRVDDEFGYESPWGYGRPSWHIECSVMSNYYLGTEFMFHGGGEDLAFPHHHNEIAQNYGAHHCCPTKLFVHNGMVNCNNCKMSKSMGNIIAINDMVKNTYDGDVMRYIFLATYYSSPVNINDDLWKNAIIIINKLRKFKFQYGYLQNNLDVSVAIDPLYDDMNTPATFTLLFNLMKDVTNYNRVMNTLTLLGFVFAPRTKIPIDVIETLLHERTIAKSNKQYDIVRKMENHLKDNFIQLQETKEGMVTWFYL